MSIINLRIRMLLWLDSGARPSQRMEDNEMMARPPGGSLGDRPRKGATQKMEPF